MKTLKNYALCLLSINLFVWGCENSNSEEMLQKQPQINKLNHQDVEKVEIECKKARVCSNVEELDLLSTGGPAADYENPEVIGKVRVFNDKEYLYVNFLVNEWNKGLSSVTLYVGSFKKGEIPLTLSEFPFKSSVEFDLTSCDFFRSYTVRVPLHKMKKADNLIIVPVLGIEENGFQVNSNDPYDCAFFDKWSGWAGSVLDLNNRIYYFEYKVKKCYEKAEVN
ncbi:hypothetical protein [Solitalea lacus]|uniref:hypothetical protein n=1 Tax=Solitalea lacus TaxID=2911172 RepID=UPI001ED9D4A5|nr:hypothetical protein [Solitalea lacus]UKJ06228.1 hypothetical protein L2B55_11845 [Solitalea lacus]